MALLTLFTKTAPMFAGVEFDAVLEDTLEASVKITDYPIENGARAADHRIIQPFRWKMVGAMSDNPLKPTLADLGVGLVTNFVSDSGIASAVAGVSAGLLAGSNETRSSAALQELIKLMISAEPFDVEAGDFTLFNMVITDITRTKTPENEGGLEFEAQLKELATLDLAVTFGGASQNQLQDGDPSKTQSASTVNKGEKGLQAIGGKALSLLEASGL